MKIKSGFLHLPLLLLILCIAHGATAQNKQEKYQISGVAIDSTTNKSVEYATAAVTDDSMKIVSMVAADGNGKFSIELKQKGKFKLTLSALGYNPSSISLDVDGSNTKIDIGKIQLTEGGIEIKEVTVAMQKPLVKSDVDKLTYSVEADPEAATSTVVEILRKVPQLSVDAEDNVSLNGQGNYKVLVNGRSSKLFSNNFKDVIRSMPASSIKDIEVITNPPSKYDAEGIGGIINIITNRKSIGGYNGRVSLGAGSFGSYNGSAYIAAQIGKFNLSANYWASRYGSPGSTSFSMSENYNSPNNRYMRSDGASNSHGLSQGTSIEASYEIDSMNLISLSFSGYGNNSKYDSESLIQYRNEMQELSMDYTNLNQGKSTNSSFSGSIDYQKTFKKPDKTFTVSYKLDNNPNKQDYMNDVDGRLNYESYARTRLNKTTDNEHTLQIDYFDPLTKMHQIEAGVKYILRLSANNSNTKQYNSDTETWEQYIRGVNDLDYTQHIFSAYGGYVFKLKKFTAKAGFRAEGTWNDGLSKIPEKDDLHFTSELFNVVPNVIFSYQIKPSQTVRLSYTQRLQRPGINLLNPYVNDLNPMYVSYGNPDLKTVIANNISANYSIYSPSWNLYAGAFSSFSDNAITSITKVDNKGVTYTTFENTAKTRTYGISVSFGYRIKTIFYINSSVSSYYSLLESPANNLKNDGFSLNGSLNVGVGLWKNARFNVSGNINSSSVGLQRRGSVNYNTSTGVSQQLFKKKVDMNLFVSNPFERTKENHSTTSDDTFYQYSEYSYHSRRFYLSMGYRFGKMDTQVKKAKRSISNDDKMSGDSSGNSSGGGK